MPHELGLRHTALILFYIKTLHSLHLHISNGYRPAISRYLNNRNTRHRRLNVLNRRYNTLLPHSSSPGEQRYGK